MSTAVPVQFLRDHEVRSNDFPGASAYQGGYAATEVAGFPADVAAGFIAAGIAAPAAPVTGAASTVPDPVTALAAAQAEIDRLGTGSANPDAAAFLAATAPVFFAGGKTAP